VGKISVASYVFINCKISDADYRHSKQRILEPADDCSQSREHLPRVSEGGSQSSESRIAIQIISVFLKIEPNLAPYNVSPLVQVLPQNI